MAPGKAIPFVLLLALALTFVAASSAAEHHPQGGGFGGFFRGIPSWFGGGQRSGAAGGWGAGGVGPGGGYAQRGVAPPSTVCTEKGPCHNRRLECPRKCFRSYSYNGKNSAGGGGGGGCTFDCTRCQARC